MRQVAIYSKTFSDVYKSCVAGVSDLVKAGNYNAALAGLQVENANYEFLARASNLYLIPAVKSRLEDVVRGALTRKDLKDLYEVNMVGQRQAARDHYDQILLSPPYKKCPYCSLGQATTLDHYLPKSRFPQFSVSVANLVPSCRDCQSKKGRDYAVNKTTQTLHPYFDSPAFFSQSWLRARLLRASTMSVEFYVDPPALWPSAMKARVEAHFAAHHLAKRFAIEAACELVSVNETVADLRAAGQFMDIEIILRLQANGHARNCVNSWQSAFYNALADDSWYCTAPVI
ncbi:hypothetical protein HEP73_03873 [Xanthomonas sp. GW]|uniref:HNH endonuclease n=1 Tax=Xanthomonas sp. GW TaxID=2724121 RepID=UPI00163B2967|nr:hypothetical protein [Xanthomonas sp. GW]QNH22924.1 hypothetical protein HEP73_03873 [Xanthomonas sp. GW]